jgi:uncharacterized membrane protein
MKKFGWISFVFFAIVIGLYPLTYLLFDMSQGLMSSKSPALLNDGFWKPVFYAHIYFGGVALLCGWSQFLKSSRSKYLKLHRFLGKIYVITVLLSGIAGLYLAFHATGGAIASFGFGILALLWLTTTSIAFIFIQKKQIEKHQHWMIRSYALCFAAVTLRLWIPFFQAVLHFEFVEGYRIIAWLCWVPNLLFAEWIIFRKRKTASEI